MKDRFKNIRGGIGTIIFHGTLLAIFLIVSFSAPFPPPEEDGLIVNFGTNERGIGRVEPQQQEYTPPIVEKQEEVTQEETSPPIVEQETITIPDEAEVEAEDLMTQELEEAARVNAQKNRQEELERQRLEELERQRQAELERQRQEELERQRLEEERIRQVELEKQRKAEEERKRREQQEQQRNAINSRIQRSFGGKNEGGSEGSEGVREGIGNQGVRNGSVESDDRTMINSSGNGISYSLEGRSVVGALKRPQYPGQESGKVVVSITVNKEGRVVSAVPGARGSTTIDSNLQNAAKKAALTARFNKVENPTAPITQKGTITYIFKLTGG